MRLFEEEVLEPVARAVRFQKGFIHVPKNKAIVLADLGCGPKIRLYNYAAAKGINIKKYIGLDPLIGEEVKKKYTKVEHIKLVKAPLKKTIPLKNNSVDIVTGFAFLEHIDKPSEILNDSIRILKKGGKAIFTTPSNRSKGILEFLSYRLNLISKREIKEHKNYFDKKSLCDLISANTNRIKVVHEFFEFGLNNLLVITKK